jgi:tripartite-type tricarboxylate transporter receptor subunit TctC
MLRQLRLFLGGSVLLSWALLACAQQYPAKPIHLVLGGGVGGGMDLAARAFTDGLARSLKQPIVVENTPGASGMLANRNVAKAAPDGYTLLALSDVLLAAPLFFKSPGFDFMSDLAPITLYARDRIILGTPYAAPWQGFNEMVTYAKANPGKLNHGTSGPGDLFAIFMAAINQQYGLRITDIGYKTGPAKTQAIVANEIQLNFFNQPLLLPMYQAKQARPLAVTGERRLAAFPDTPTFVELGVPGMRDNCHMLLAPAGTPAPIIQTLYAAMAQVLKEPEVVARLNKLGGLEASWLTPDETRKYLADALSAYGTVARNAGIQPQ